MKVAVDLFIKSLPERPHGWKASKKGPVTVPKLYEVYVYSLVARQFNLRKWQLNHYKKGGKVIGRDDFIFRGSPGNLWGGKEFSFILLDKGAKKYELHLSIEISGLSKVYHEIDIGVFDHLPANAATVGSSHQINGSQSPLTIECKNYNIPLKKNIARECLGVATDTERCDPHQIAMFVTSTCNGEVKKLLESHDIKYFSNFEPSNAKEINGFNKSIKEFIDGL